MSSLFRGPRRPSPLDGALAAAAARGADDPQTLRRIQGDEPHICLTLTSGTHGVEIATHLPPEQVVAGLRQSADEYAAVHGLTDEPETATVAEPTPSTPEPAEPFFEPGQLYRLGEAPYTAPEATWLFRVEHVTRHPDRGQLRAIGWLKTQRTGDKWHLSFRDEDEFADGWTVVPADTAGDLT